MKAFVVIFAIIAFVASGPLSQRDIADVLKDPSSTQEDIIGALQAEGKDFICNGELDRLMLELNLHPGPTVGVVFMVKIQTCSSSCKHSISEKHLAEVLKDPSSTTDDITGALVAEGKDFICNGELDKLMNELKLPPGPTVGIVYMVKVRTCSSFTCFKHLAEVLKDPSSTTEDVTGALVAEGKDFICNGELDELMNELKLPPGPTVGIVFMVKVRTCSSLSCLKHN
ncbi:uncharacterized protein LOC134819319 [Bolinopsis microptera]|uniref:uncharacterized protein LOC134819319 n=1 Tax=Bolinopsis microptera TaxID=2820187 RepID=UPI00307AF534